jgi:hypothetical protein
MMMTIIFLLLTGAGAGAASAASGLADTVFPFMHGQIIRDFPDF